MRFRGDVLKFAIVGTHGSGKTTTLKYVVETLRWINFPPAMEDGFRTVDEVARLCPYRPLGENGSFKAQNWIMLNQILYENDRKEEKLSIFDRSVFDQLAYVIALNKRGRINDKKMNYLKTVAFNWDELYPYDALFWLSPLGEEGLRDKDELRSKNIGFQEEIHNHLREIFSNSIFKYRVLYIDDRDILERVSRIVQYIVCRYGCWNDGKTHAIFFDVDGTLRDWEGIIEPKDIPKDNYIFRGYISLRDDSNDDKILREKYGLSSPPIPWTTKNGILKFVRHVLRNIPPTNFIYVGDKVDDKNACGEVGWRYLSPEEFVRGDWFVQP